MKKSPFNEPHDPLDILAFSHIILRGAIGGIDKWESCNHWEDVTLTKERNLTIRTPIRILKLIKSYYHRIDMDCPFEDIAENEQAIRLYVTLNKNKFLG